MEKIKFTLRAGCFLSVYLLIYFVPIVAIHFSKHMPRLVGNFCFSFPQLMFPFDIMFWKYTRIISNDSVYFLISGLYLLTLSLTFAFLTRFVGKSRWIIPFAFCFSILSVVALNFVLLACGITVETKMP
jgi:hypothetical protein